MASAHLGAMLPEAMVLAPLGNTEPEAPAVRRALAADVRDVTSRPHPRKETQDVGVCLFGESGVLERRATWAS